MRDLINSIDMKKLYDALDALERRIDRLDSPVDALPMNPMRQPPNDPSWSEDDDGWQRGDRPDEVDTETPDSEPTSPVVVIEEYTPLVVGQSGLVIHMHTPEGKEIGTITNVISTDFTSSHGVEGIAFAPSEHGEVFLYTSGVQNVQVSFNGISLETGDITMLEGFTYTVTFTFSREDANLAFSNSGTASQSESWTTYYDNTIVTNGGGMWSMLQRLQNFFDASGSGVQNYTYTATDSSFSVTLTAEITGSGKYIGGITSTNAGADFLSASGVPVRTNFTNWFAQSSASGVYPYISLYKTDQIGSYILTQSAWAGNSLCFTRVPASNSYSYLKVYFPSHQRFSVGINNVPLNIHYTGTNDLRMASVPYDVDGTAV